MKTTETNRTTSWSSFAWDVTLK